MARRVFFSFHYQEDIWRVNQIRHVGVTRDWEALPFLDAASWEAVKRRGEAAIKEWIDRQLDGTGVTVVLIGSQTADRKYVRYEIEESHRRGNGLIGIRIHKLENQRRETAKRGRNPLADITTTVQETGFLGLWTDKVRKSLSQIYPVYDWVEHDGYKNIGHWIEEAAKKAGR
jgi:broad specificity phosphatase PhoE